MTKKDRAGRHRAAARARFKADREQGRSALDDAVAEGPDDEDNVFEYLDEQEYQRLVEARREREDFVVDDDGLGYYDDGEERYGEEAEYHEKIATTSGKNKRSASATAVMTAAALKKARQNHQAQLDSGSTAAGAPSNNKTMWDFVNRASLVSRPTTSTDVLTSGSATRPSQAPRNAGRPATSVDALLEQLDQDEEEEQQQHIDDGDYVEESEIILKRSQSGRSVRPRSRFGRRPAGRARRALVSAASTRSHAATPRTAPAGYTSTREDPDLRPMQPLGHAPDHTTSTMDAHDDQEVDGGGAWDDDQGDHPQDRGSSTPLVSLLKKRSPHPDSSTKSVRFADSSSSENTQDNDNSENQKPNEQSAVSDAALSSSQGETVSSDTASSSTTVAGRRLVRPKIRSTIPTPKAPEQPVAPKSSDLGGGNAKEKKGIALANALSASFQPESIVAVESNASIAGQVPLADVVVKSPTDEADDYLDMYWMDLCERNGDILLFGKVATDSSRSKFVSACAVVTGNVRNLFVLPRRLEDGSYASFQDVHQELTQLFHQTGMIPRKAGVSWAGKVVQRNYAFEDGTVPREPTNYMKVVYEAKYGVPEEDVCLNGGQHFAKILGAGASVVENFIVKRKLMGPCWIRIKKPTASRSPCSWCRVEFTVESPKWITRLDLAAEGLVSPPPPPVVTMCIKLKTAVNPKTHKSEIVSISAICHKYVMLETASDESPKHMTQLSLIRPLGHQSSAHFPRDIDQEIARGMPQLRQEVNERAMLSHLFAQIGQWDPDVVAGHNAWGYDMEILLSRCIELKVPTWSKIGRRRRTELPSKTHFSSRRDVAIADAICGRLLCDTYLSAQELLRETTYSLTHLANAQLKVSRQEIEPVDIPLWFESSKTIVQLALSTLFDAQLVLRLMFKLQVLPLTKQLTCIAGNIWSHTLKSNRAERTEYLLLHEFHRLKFIPPEKRRPGKKLSQASGKAKYSGGLVLEPKKGLYDSFILLLDFNSLYPSIIQEYNLCFTTIDWSSFRSAAPVADDEEAPSTDNLPPPPDESTDRGVLPRVIKSLVDRRRDVKKILKTERDPQKKEELDIRQKALKLTANSMYGCLGFSNSRFYAQPIAALVTAMGRETLQRTVDIAQNSVGLDVIYGDTDSIMINTRISDVNELKQVMQLGERVKSEVNRLYRTLELEIDGVFRCMLLLKKKKYAAKTVEIQSDGTVKYGQELKGLDLVRRDWCVQSRDTGRFVTEQILSGQDSELVIQSIHSHLDDLAKRMRSGSLPLEKYVITKGLSKHPNDYPDGKSQPHVQVAKIMLKNNRPVNTGDHIPYIITAAETVGPEAEAKLAPAAERARHPDDIVRSGGSLKPDVEWYLTQQILPPVARLCEPIEGVSQQSLAASLGLDPSRYNQLGRASADVDDDLIDYTPASFLLDEERFKLVEKLRLFCFACGEENIFPGVFHVSTDPTSGVPCLVSGLRCTNVDCVRPLFWGHSSRFECYAHILNTTSIWIHGLMKKYYEGWVRCDEASCQLETRQLSVCGRVCLNRGCNGRMIALDSEREIHNHLKYLESLFDVKHVCEQLERKKIFKRKQDIVKDVAKSDQTMFNELHGQAKKCLESNAFNWISSSFWKGLFCLGTSSGG